MELDVMTYKELREELKRRNVSGRSYLRTKQQMYDALRADDTGLASLMSASSLSATEVEPMPRRVQTLFASMLDERDLGRLASTSKDVYSSVMPSDAWRVRAEALGVTNKRRDESWEDAVRRHVDASEGELRLAHGLRGVGL